MIKNFKNTYYGRILSTKELEVELLKYYYEGINTLSNSIFLLENNVVYITGKYEREKDLPLFTVPVITEDNKGNKVIFVDLRMYSKSKLDDLENLKDMKSNKAEFDFEIMRSVLLDKLLTDSSNLSKYRSGGAILYGAWLTSAVGRNLNFNMNEQFIFNFLSVLFFLCISHPKETLDKSDIEAIKVRSRNIVNKNMTLDTVDELVGDVDLSKCEINTLIELVKNNEKEYGGFSRFSLDVLVNFLNGYWFGLNVDEKILLSLDHVPTFLTLMYQALTDRTYRKTRMTTVVSNMSRNTHVKELTKELETLQKEIEENF